MKLLRFGLAFCLLRQMWRLVEKTEIPIFPAKAELQAKKDAEIKVENERKQVGLKAKAEAEKNAKAPIKKQLSIWVDSFSISEINIENDKKALIKEKFEAFKKWAKNEIESI